jgi:hypothetical protein
VKRCAIGSAVTALVLFGCLAFGSGTATAQPTVAKIFHTEKLPLRQPNELVTVRVTCPPGYKAASGSTYPLPFDVTLVKSASRGRERIFLVSPAGYGATEVTFVVTCWKLAVAAPGGAKLKLPFKIKKRKVPVVPFVPMKAQIRCQGGQAPVGAGFDLKPQIKPNVARGSTLPSTDPSVPYVRWFIWKPVHGGWKVGLELRGGAPLEVEVEVSCVGRETTGRDRDGRRVTETVQILRRTFKEMVPAGGGGFEHTCPRDLSTVRTGFETEPSSTAWWSASHVNEMGGGSWLWINTGTAPVAVTNYLLCAEIVERVLRR